MDSITERIVKQLELKYLKARDQQIELKRETPLNNAVQHQLLDQNIHIFDGVLKDLKSIH